MPMIRAHSQRALQPYSAQVQIAESDLARAVTLDGEVWELQHIYSTGMRGGSGPAGDARRFIRAGHIRRHELAEVAQSGSVRGEPMDPGMRALVRFIAEAELPFPAADRFEYWLLDAKDEAPLALIFSCVDAMQMAAFPNITEWTALPAARMPIETSEQERQNAYGPVNYRLERRVADRAGSRPRARWFTRRADEDVDFPALLLREDWDDAEGRDLCRRYLQRQSPRLLMLHGLPHDDRARMERAARPHALDLARFYPLYPAVADRETVDRIRVEARLRMAAGEQAHSVGGLGRMASP
jgi:hypothetical protein